MKKTKRLYVEQRSAFNDATRTHDHLYVVKKANNSTEVKIGQTLTKAELDAYCDKADWQVTIT